MRPVSYLYLISVKSSKTPSFNNLNKIVIPKYLPFYLIEQYIYIYIKISNH